MCSRRHRLPAFAVALLSLLCLLAVAGCGGGGVDTSREASQPGAAPGGFDAARAFADLRTQVDFGPRPSGSGASAKTARFIAEGLQRAGLDDVRIQRPLANVIGVIPGEGPGYIVVGAHYDTKDIAGFVGANDGASGVAVALELARTLPRPLSGPSIVIALFDGEEARGDREFSTDGKRGSTQYVSYAKQGVQSTPPLDQTTAMVLFDLVGDCDLQVPLEPGSDVSLYERFRRANNDVFSGRTFPIDDDHVPFAEAGIPAVDLIDFNYGPGASPGAYWHTTEDTIDKVCPASLGAVGTAALDVIPGLH